MPTSSRESNGQFAKTAFTLLVTGSRNWDSVESVRDELVKVKDLAVSLGLTPSQVTLVHGNAQGADRIAGTLGSMLGFNVHAVPADWNKHQFANVDGENKQVCRCDIPNVTYCKMAGITRNLRMLDDYKPDMVLAFNRDSSSGTMHTITESRKRSLITTVVRYEDVVTNASGGTVPDGTSHSVTDLKVTDDPFSQYRV